MASTEPAQKFFEAARHLDAGWSPERAAAVERALTRRRRDRTRGRYAFAALLALGFAGTWLLMARTRSPSSLDGVTLTAAGPSSQVKLLNDNAVALEQGSARFEVRRPKARPVAVHLGSLEVAVHDGRFLMEQVSGGARLLVEEGEAEVRWPNGSATLRAGEGGVFPPPPAPTPAVAPSKPSEPEQALAVPRSPEPSRQTPPPAAKPGPETETWQTIARSGDFDRAYGELRKAAPPRDETEELMLAADVARLSGHPEEALESLRKVSSGHPNDPRAPLAAFTLGRLLLDELGRPREAADAFDRALELSPTAPLSEDALAREVEAWSRAGDATRARQLAEKYLATWPKGQRARAVRYHGGLP
jgi:transmembrane sensor